MSKNNENIARPLPVGYLLTLFFTKLSFFNGKLFETGLKTEQNLADAI